MQLDLATFNNAAMRLTAKQGTCLSTSQQVLAEIFGFDNLDDAFKTFVGKDVLSTPSGESTWHGFPLEEAVEKIISTSFSGASLNDPWRGQSQRLLKIVLNDLITQNNCREISSKDIESSLKFEAIEQGYVALFEIAGADGEFPRKSQGLRLYLETLPGYSIKKLHRKHGLDEGYSTAGVPPHHLEQDSMTLDQHKYRVAPILFALLELDEKRAESNS